MGCSSSKTEDEDLKNLKPNKIKPNNAVTNQKVNANTAIEVLENKKEENTLLKVDLDKITNKEIEISYYTLEIIGKNEIKFKEKFSYKEKRVNSKSNFLKYFKNEDCTQPILKNLQRDKMEYIIYVFNYTSGKRNICNFYEAEEIDLRSKSLETDLKRAENDINENGGNNEIVDENFENKNNEENNALLENGSNTNELNKENGGNMSHKKNIHQSNKVVDLSKDEFVYSIWLIDIDLIDLEPREVISIIKDAPKLECLSIKCENLGDVYIETEPDLNDDGKVNIKLPENKKEVNIFREINEEIMTQTIESVKTDYVYSFSIRRNKFIEKDSLNKILDVISMYPDRITTFIFSDNLNLGEKWSDVVKVLESLTNLTHLQLSMAFISDRYLIPIFNSIKKKRIQVLDLSSNFLTYYGARIIGKWIKGNRTLKELYVHQNTMNEFKREGFDFICEPLIKHPNIEILDVSFMILTGFSSKLSELIIESKTLRVLKIKNTRMNIQDYHTLIPVLCNNNTIEELYLSDNNPMKEESIELITKLINTNKKIHSLYLDKIGLNLENCKQFFLALKKNTNIHTISLNDNVEVSIRKYVDFFLEAKHIKKLNLMNRNSLNKRLKDDIRLLEKLKEERPDMEFKF